MDGKLIPQSNSTEKTHQDYYNKLLSKYSSQNCNGQSNGETTSFRCKYEKAQFSDQSLNQKLVIGSNLTFLIEGKIVCKSCNKYRPQPGGMLYYCPCGHMAHLDITITNLDPSATGKVNIKVGIEKDDSTLMNIFNEAIDLEVNKKCQKSWKFEESSKNGHYGYHGYYGGTLVWGGDYLSQNGDLTLICDVEVFRIKNPGWNERIAERFSGLNINPATPTDQFSDVILCVGKDKIYSHKIILGMASKFFERMFTSDMKESKDEEIVLKEIDLETLKSLLMFVYKNQIPEEKIDFKLLAAADMYEIMNLRSICIDRLSKAINQENVGEIWLTAYQHNIEDLTHDATVYMAKNWKELKDSDDIRELCQRYTALLFTISSLNVDHP